MSMEFDVHSRTLYKLVPENRKPKALLVLKSYV